MNGLRVGVIALLLAAASTGCISNAKDDTKIGKGESFTSGDPKYDEFFQSVLDVQAKVADADGETPLKKTLADGVGVKPTATTDEMIAAAKTKAQAVKSGGGGLYVQLLPEAKLFSKGGKQAPKGEGETFTKALEKTVHDGVAHSDELSGIGSQIHDLEGKVDDLSAGVDKTFSDPKRKDEVTKELAAAKDVLERSRLKAYAESGRALAFVVGVVRAVDTDSFDPSLLDGKPGPKQAVAGPVGGGHPVKAKPKQDFDP